MRRHARLYPPRFASDPATDSHLRPGLDLRRRLCRSRCDHWRRRHRWRSRRGDETRRTMEHHGRQPGQENKTKSLENLAELNLKIHRMTKISIVVPCYNSAKFLFATIESVLRQELKGWEFILVDDGSKDATWEIVSRYMLMDPRIIGYQKPNGGTSKARNFGF